MNKKTFYFCDICGLGYPEEESALKCESSHNEVVSIQTFYETGSVKPSVIEALLSDGTKMKFISETLIKVEQE